MVSQCGQEKGGVGGGVVDAKGRRILNRRKYEPLNMECRLIFCVEFFFIWFSSSRPPPPPTSPRSRSGSGPGGMRRKEEEEEEEKEDRDAEGRGSCERANTIIVLEFFYYLETSTIDYADV